MIERHVVIGAGPAGLTIAWQLARLGKRVLILEADREQVGGLARTMSHREHRYDLGPHRLYTRSEVIRGLWEELLGDELLEVPRLTRIRYEGRYFHYPLKLREVLEGLGWLRAVRICTSGLRARILPRRPERSFEDWAVNRFGRELFRAFFQTYTEKVWGMPCDRIDRDWAAQRIRGLSLMRVLRHALRLRGGDGINTLVDRFLYPRLGIGQLWDTVLERVLEGEGNRLELGKRVVRIRREGRRVRALEVHDRSVCEGTHFYMTLPLSELAAAMDPAPPPEILSSARALRHRGLLVVALLVRRSGLFPDQWIYVHDPSVRVARITNPSTWSPAMAPDPERAMLVLEYFCDREEALHTAREEELLALAAGELQRLGIAEPCRPVEGRVHRLAAAYPVYDGAYRAHRSRLREWLDADFDNLQCAGRHGLHNYNSQDHAMMTGLIAVRNMVAGAGRDGWAVNTEEEYAEDGVEGTRSAAP